MPLGLPSLLNMVWALLELIFIAPISSLFLDQDLAMSELHSPNSGLGLLVLQLV